MHLDRGWLTPSESFRRRRGVGQHQFGGDRGGGGGGGSQEYYKESNKVTTSMKTFVFCLLLAFFLGWLS